MEKNLKKTDIRKLVFERRKTASLQDITEKSVIICKKIIAMPEFKEAASVYVYMDCKNEVSTALLRQECYKLGKKVAAPKVCGMDMKYYYLRSDADVAPGYFQVPEPDLEKGLQEADDENALIIVPGVAFDRNRHRCGYGKGFYDRYLREHDQHKTLAIAFDFQMMEEVPAESFDICPQKLITESATYEEGEGDQV